jgi:hypothetical protein
MSEKRSPSDDAVTLAPLAPRLIAAVRRTAAPREVSTVFRPALDQVWAFLRAHPGLRTDGHNVFLYHHVDRPEDGMPIDFGVEVTRRFDPEGEVHCRETPAGEAAVLVHRGAYSGLAGRTRRCTAGARRTGARSAPRASRSTATGRTIPRGSKRRSSTCCGSAFTASMNRLAIGRELKIAAGSPLPRLAQILGWAAAGRLRPHVSHTFALADFQAAMRAKWNGEVIGGCVLHP